MIAKDIHAILASIKPQRIFNLSINTCTITIESRGNIAVDLFHVWSFRIKFGLFLQTLENHFEVNIDTEETLKLVLPTMKSHEGILFNHVYPHHFVVYAIFEVLVPGLFPVESLKAVQAEVLLAVILTITTFE